jgi:hypothetical protein
MTFFKAHGDAEATATAAYQALRAQIRAELDIDRTDGDAER